MTLRFNCPVCGRRSISAACRGCVVEPAQPDEEMTDAERVFHETRYLRQRANAAVLGDDDE